MITPFRTPEPPNRNRDIAERLIARLGHDAIPFLKLMLKANIAQRNAWRWPMSSRRWRKWHNEMMRLKDRIDRIWERHPHDE